MLYREERFMEQSVMNSNLWEARHETLEIFKSS